jgi:uncharacterized protein (DUF488 family)
MHGGYQIMDSRRTLFTIGYGGRGRDEFTTLLRDHEVEVVADVRMHPERASMGIFVKAKTADKGIEKTLGQAGIGYEWFEELGNPDPKDPEMQAFRDLIGREGTERTARLRELAARKTVCLLCAEKSPGACHRSIVSDFLAGEGWEVLHL